MFPNINYKATNTKLDTTLQTLLETKLSSLAKYLTGTNSVLCEAEFEKETAHANGRHFRVEINLVLDGVLYRAEATEERFEEAIDEVRSELDKELRRANDKATTMMKRGGRMFKQMVQGV